MNPRVSLDDLAAELGIRQTVEPWQPLPPVTVLKRFDQTIPPEAVDIHADHADKIRDNWAEADAWEAYEAVGNPWVIDADGGDHSE